MIFVTITLLKNYKEKLLKNLFLKAFIFKNQLKVKNDTPKTNCINTVG